MSLGTDTFDDRYFALFFQAHPKSRYCSFKVPYGYAVDVDYYGFGFDDPRTHTYNNNITRLGRGFRRIRIRKTRTAPRPGTGAPEVRCESNWGAKLYSEGYYKGMVTCMSEQTILPSQKPKSFKVRPGYVLILFHRGQEVRRFTKNTTYFGWPFDYVRVMKDYSGRQSSASSSSSNSRRRSTPQRRSRSRDRGLIRVF